MTEMTSKRVTVHPSSAALPKLTDFELQEQSQNNLSTALDEIPTYVNADVNSNSKSSRFSELAISISPAETSGSILKNAEFEQSTNNGDGDVEKISDDLLHKVKVIASGLQKTYPNGKVAVKNFTLAMLEGQITCLLGM